MTEPQWNMYTFDEPQQIVAGEDDLDGSTIYFDCAECGEVDAVMAGYVGSGPNYEDVALINDAQTKYQRPAFYCGACWKKLIESQEKNEGN